MSSNFHLTKFEHAVLSSVQKVTAGHVTTYAALAHAIGKPRAFRAVGQALNKNPDLITVPCHRVVRSDGTIGGYRLGATKKKKVLATEGIFVTPDGRIKNFLTLQHHF